jgi:hypothetical protein
MGLSNSKTQIVNGEVYIWWCKSTDYILLFTKKSKNVLISRDGLKLLIYTNKNSRFEEYSTIQNSLDLNKPTNITYCRVTPHVSPMIVKDVIIDINDKKGFVDKAMLLIKFLQTVKLKRSQKHDIKWIEKTLLQF